MFCFVFVFLPLADFFDLGVLHQNPHNLLNLKQAFLISLSANGKPWQEFLGDMSDCCSFPVFWFQWLKLADISGRCCSLHTSRKKLLASWSVRFEGGKKKQQKNPKPNNTSCAESLNIGISSFYPAYGEEPSVSKPCPGVSGRLAVRAHHQQQLTFGTDFWFKVFCFCLTTLWLCYQLEIRS